jgi:hypothetical protein
MLWTIVGAIVTLCVKEDQAIFLAIGGALGAWYFRGTKPARVAGAIAVVSVLLLIVFFGYIQPHAAAAARIVWQPERFYAWNGADAVTILAGIAARLGFLLLIFAPLLFLPLRSQMFWLAVAPLAEVVFSRMSTTFTVGTHYAGAWVGYVLVAFAFAVRQFEPRQARILLTVCIALSLLEFAVADPLHPGINLRVVESRDVALDQFLETLPSEVSIATQEEAYTHLALIDPYARLLPESRGTEARACFVLIDRDFPNSARLQEYGEAFQVLLENARYTEVGRSGGIELYRRTSRCF